MNEDFDIREERFAQGEKDFGNALRLFDELMWYVIANNRIEGDGSGATSQPKAPFKAVDR